MIIPALAVIDPSTCRLPLSVNVLAVVTVPPLAIVRLLREIPLPLIDLDAPVIDIVLASAVIVPDPVVEILPRHEHPVKPKLVSLVDAAQGCSRKCR